MRRLNAILSHLTLNSKISSAADPLSLSDVLEWAKEWVEWDPNQKTNQKVSELLKAKNHEELTKLFYPRIDFGTAGLRGRMEAGYHNINELVIIQTTQGFLRYLLENEKELQKDGRLGKDGVKAGIVIGYDGRHNSKTYAYLTAAVFLSQKVPVFLFNDLICTPMVPFGVLQCQAAAGIMVTASHNPKDDNGYKVYLSNGCQIISPYDRGIAEAILKNRKPWEKYSTENVEKHSLRRDPTQKLTEIYMTESLKRYSFRSKEENANAKLRITYTAMHGVGAVWTANVIKHFNLPPFIPVKEQISPDADFPTVKFPNPEEGKGALALAIKTADANGSPLILANDPDADRLAIAEKSENKWEIFSGNEIALLLADWVWENFEKNHPKADKKKAFMLASTVSSKVLKSMAEHHGFTFVDTLTGFKWMGNVASDMEKKGYQFLFAYEVEIGFLVGNLSYDKDGVRTSAIFYEMAVDRYNKGITLSQRLKYLYQKYGYFVMNPGYYFCDSTEKLDRVFGRLRKDGKYPDKCGPFKIKSVRDVTLGYDSGESNKISKLPKQPDAQMITFRFENGGTMTLRNSGTEPKLKYYVECSAKEREEAQKLTQSLSEWMVKDFIQPEKNGLVPQQK